MPTKRPSPLLEPPSMDALKHKALEVHHVLCGVYGCPVAFFSDDDPMSNLVSNLMSHRTKNADTARAFKSLRARFAT